MLDVPAIDEAFKAQQTPKGKREEWRVRVKRRGELSTITYPYNPLDAVGWHGDLAPVRLNWRDIRPLMSHRSHLPPSAHTTFVADRFVVCTFVPRPFESDPGALKVPFFHSNDDYDEVIFYHRGSSSAATTSKPGMVTLHPGGFHARPASQGAGRRARAEERRDRRSRGDARRARRARDREPPAGHRGSGLRELLAHRRAMKLASLKRGGRDGTLVVVSRDLARCVAVPDMATTLQKALDDWRRAEPALRDVAARLEAGKLTGPERFDPAQATAPLPRAYQWADGSAYVNHVELVRKARGAEMPPSFWTDPLMYQGGSDSFIGATDDILAGDEAWGIDFEGEVAVITDDVPMGVSPAAAAGHIKLLMLVNDVSLAQSHPGRARQGLRLLPGQARDGVLAGGGDAGRTGRMPGMAARCICRW